LSLRSFGGSTSNPRGGPDTSLPMPTTFSLLLVNPGRGRPIAVACVLVPLLLALAAGQLWPAATQALGVLPYLLLSFSVFLLGNQVFKKYGLEAAEVALSPASLTVTYASGRAVCLPLAQVQRYRHLVVRGSHHLTLYTAGTCLHLATSGLHAKAANDRQVRALEQELAHRLAPARPQAG